jgi:hypothetical protein
MKTAELTVAESLIYGRRRIIKAIYKTNPDSFGMVQASDIKQIQLIDDMVACYFEDFLMYVNKSDVIESFWKHRTRTPSFFEYKIWKAYADTSAGRGTPIGAIEYGSSPGEQMLEAHLGPRLAVDENGVKKLYFVDEDQGVCTCGSWCQLHQHREELEKEFEQYSSIAFAPVCKHLQWAKKYMELQSYVFSNKEKDSEYNPRICVYHFDHKRGRMCYRVTYDGVKANGKWLPASGWQEKEVYTIGNMPTGECWNTLFGAVKQPKPFKIVPYSSALGALMSRSSGRGS